MPYQDPTDRLWHEDDGELMQPQPEGQYKENAGTFTPWQPEPGAPEMPAAPQRGNPGYNPQLGRGNGNVLPGYGEGGSVFMGGGAGEDTNWRPMTDAERSMQLALPPGLMTDQQIAYQQEQDVLNRDTQSQYHQDALDQHTQDLQRGFAEMMAGNAGRMQGAQEKQAAFAADVAGRSFAPGQEFARGYEPGGMATTLGFAPVGRAQGIPVSTDTGLDALRQALAAAAAQHPGAPVGG